jgi:hypothetical protein
VIDLVVRERRRDRKQDATEFIQQHPATLLQPSTGDNRHRRPPQTGLFLLIESPLE